MQWPPDYVAEWNRRAKLRNDCLDDPRIRAGLQIHYKHNPVDWIQDWCVTFDPRRKGVKLLPFLLFPRQHDFIQFLWECWLDREDGLVEKARDMGATWEACAFSAWLWLYWAGSVAGWGSRKSEYVDKMGDPKAIFPKIRQILDNLPVWMMPEGFNENVHDNFMRLINPEKGSAITGESGDSMGRGGRTSIYFKDESAHYEHPEMVEAALGDNTDVQIDISSVNGSANVFYRRRMAGEVWYRGCSIPKGVVRVFIFDWSDHPNKTQEWFDEREAKATREGLLHIFRQEVCRDYAGSIDRIIIRPEWIEASVDAHMKLGFGMDGEKVAGQDVADGGGDKNALAIRHGVVLKFIDHWGGEAGDAAKVAVPRCVEHGAYELYYDSIGVGAGFKTGINHMRDQESYPQHLRVMPWNAASSVLDPTDHIIPGDDQSPTNENQYLNLKAQGWFRLRARFYKTFRAVRHGEYYDPAEMISLDSTMEKLQQLKMELSQATHAANTKGKTVVDKKPDGAISPNLADAAVICYNPTRETSILDVL